MCTLTDEPKGLGAGRSRGRLLRCRRCGRMLHVTYSGTHGDAAQVSLPRAQINHGEDWCISFGGLAVDRPIAAVDPKSSGRQRG